MRCSHPLTERPKQLIDKVVVDSATKSRDAIQKRYDASRTWNALNNRYQKTQDLVNGIEQAFDLMARAQEVTCRRGSGRRRKDGQEGFTAPGRPKFLDAKGGGFP